MMNLDQARAGGEGVVSSVKKKKKPTEMDEGAPTIFQTEEEKLKLAVPEGWSVSKSG